ncbi:MAG: cobalamin biosynthesis protein CbiM [Hyphomicrobiaceae bacterium]|nr:cobalamin biosynthesis protein CbiM [Hyphomicrobiaceae bacterium]
MIRLVFALLALLAVAIPAQAHRLKLFATVEAGNVSGYAFFVGGGRAAGVRLTIRDRDGHLLHGGETDADGGFRFAPDRPIALVIAVESGDGHIAETSVDAERFGAGANPPLLAATLSTVVPEAAPAPAAESPPLDLSAAAEARIAALVEAATARAVAAQIRPLLEAHAASEGRARFNDIVGGIGMIVGLCGLAAWGFSRRRPS